MTATHRLIATARATKKIYVEAVRGTWSELSPQPAWGTAGGPDYGYGPQCPIGLPGGGIICWRVISGQPNWCHFDGVSWSYKAKATGATQDPAQGMALDATHVYSIGNGEVQFFNGTSWTKITPTMLATGGSGGYGVVKVHALSATDVWAAGSNDTYPGGALWRYNGGAWTDYWATPKSQFGLGACNVADVCGDGTDAYFAVGDFWSLTTHCVLRYHSGTWSMLGAQNLGWMPFAIWATSPTDVWAIGYDSRTSSTIHAHHWDGSSWTTGQALPPSSGTALPPYNLRTLIGTNDNHLTCLTGAAAASTSTVRRSENDVATWTSPSGVGGNNPDALSIYLISIIPVATGGHIAEVYS